MRPLYQIKNSRTLQLLLLAAAILILLFVATQHRPFASAEVKFADASKSGLSIVPASCPSTPHYREECDIPPPPPGKSGGCLLSAYPSSITRGQGTTLSWSIQLGGSGSGSSGAPGGYSIPVAVLMTPNVTPHLQATELQGARTAGPTVTTTYTLSGTYATRDTFSCSTTVVVDGECPAGYSLQNGQCVATVCPTGYTLQNGQCVITQCPAGYTLQNGQCVNQCGAQYFCQGSDVYQRNNSDCSANFIQHCSAGCSNGACIRNLAPASLTWDVKPVLVQQGTPVRVTWDAQNVNSCTVSGTNGDGTGNNATGAWNTTSGDKTTSPIVGQTIYSIICQASDGSTIGRSTTVNVVPVFIEE